MKIETKCSADISGFAVKRNQSHDGKEGYVDLDVGVNQEDARPNFGEVFERLAFGTMGTEIVDGTETIKHYTNSTTPGNNVVCERHVVVVGDHEIKDLIKIAKIVGVKGTARVVATIRVPIDMSKKKLVSDMAQSVGQTVSVEFSPSQLPLPMPEANEES